jgi:hypothetical protein
MKELLKYCVGIVIIGLILWGIISKIFNGDVLPKQNNVAEIVSIDKKPAKITVDKDSNTHASKEVISLSHDQRDLYLHKEIDSLNSVIGTKNDQIVGLTTMNSKFRYELTYRTDSTTKPGEDKRYIIDQKSKWFSAKGIIPGPTPIIIEGSDSSTLAFTKKGRKLMADIHSYNPDMKYYGLRSFIVPEQGKSGFGVGIKSIGLFDGKFNYQNTGVSGGAKFMHIGEKWMYDAGAGGVYFRDGSGLQPFISFGIYKKL